MTSPTLTGPTLTVATATVAGRRAPVAGGLNPTLLGIELRRVFRNSRTLIFTLVMPAVFFLIFGTASAYKTQSAGHGNVTAYVLVSMAVYAALLATTSGGAAVSIERAAGWSRQLRLTPLNPAAYITVKLITAMALGLVSVLVVMAVGRFAGAQMPVHIWLASATLAWVFSLTFAALGLFMGYLLPSDNVMQILGPVLAMLSFAGGIFIPLDQMGHTFATVAMFSPVYGVGQIARAPLTGSGFTVTAFVNVIVWTALFAGGAIWRFRRDTSRV